jgi:hypothetical protein
MRKIKLSIMSGFLIALGALSVAPEARAYVDPSSAGLLYQIFFPVVVAIGLAWRWIKEMVKQVWSKITRTRKVN